MLHEYSGPPYDQFILSLVSGPHTLPKDYFTMQVCASIIIHFSQTWYRPHLKYLWRNKSISVATYSLQSILSLHTIMMIIMLMTANILNDSL